MDAQDITRPYRLMARANRLANLRLANACAALPAGAWAAPRTGFFPSLKATMNHILTVDLFYVDALEGGALGPAAFADPEPCADIAALKTAQGAVDDRLIAWCERLTPGDMGRIIRVHRQTTVQQEAVPELLCHVFLHSTHHRGQAHAMLSGTPVPPPQLDEFICRGEGAERAPEMAELGWDEGYLAS